MRVFVLHLLDESRAILPGQRIEAISPHELTGIVETWQSPGAERVLFVDSEAPNPIAWLGGTIQVDLGEAAIPKPPTPGDIDALRRLESELPSAPLGPIRKACPHCHRLFGHDYSLHP